MPSSSPTKRYHHGDLRKALIRSATARVEEVGPDQLSLRSLARDLGVSHAAPRHHFADKRELLCELAADGFSELADGLEDLVGGGEDDILARAARVYADVALDNPQRFRLMFSGGFLAEDCPERLRVESSRAFMALLRVARGSDIEADPATFEMEVPEFAIWSIVHGASTLWIDGALKETLDRSVLVDLLSSTMRQIQSVLGR